ncbi:type I-E CRISPR-associated protein Cas7/Cse4/CasC [Pusillimonas sp. TS35]|nr:type I-E CRISPR-associated protein Cas7/Cse4/CasC [Pusillimonas sp. TS35]
MTHFIQLHLLVSYPPSNLNRDDTGQPKTARMGGVERLRISSQSLKRAWRTSELFQKQLAGTIGTRTKLLGKEFVYDKLVAQGVSEKKAGEWAKQIAAVYGKLKAEKDKPYEIEQLVHVGPAELDALVSLVDKLAAEQRPPQDEELDALLFEQSGVDIALFGRMLASKQKLNTEAAAQVAHALGVHACAVEDDYFTAVDDLNKTDAGAAHVDQAGFASSVFYQYLCIDRDLLVRNLAGDEALAQRAITALVEAAVKVGPTGKQNSYASRAYAHYVLAEKGEQMPRSLALAFVKPVEGHDYLHSATAALGRLRDNMDQVYGTCAEARYELDVLNGAGRLAELLDFVAAE